MDTQRKCGIILHPTSLPSPYGIGDFGKGAYEFVDFLQRAKQNIWQVLPLGPTGYGDSPYQNLSVFAGNHNMISPDLIIKDGYLRDNDLAAMPTFDSRNVDYGIVIEYKMNIFRIAFERFQKHASIEHEKEYNEFCQRNKEWLDDYTLFVCLKKHFIEERKKDINNEAFKLFHEINNTFLTDSQIKDYYLGGVWNSWPMPIARREKNAVEKYRALLSSEIKFQSYLQYVFSKQWKALKKYANNKGVKIIGDIPFYVALDSADAWSKPELFAMDEVGNPIGVSGCPPDHYTDVGQVWGTPLYDWSLHKEQDYAWWVSRYAHMIKSVDVIRIDHFRGFESYWSIPYGDANAKRAEWKKGPGIHFFETLRLMLGEIPVIVEDLGQHTDKARLLRAKLGFPGTKVLHYSFDPNAKSIFSPHNFKDSNTVLYTATHDSDTSVGWYQSATPEERDYYRRYMNVDGSNVAWDLIRLAWSSCADYAIAPMQDVLSLGTTDRMCTPGKAEGSWTFRYTCDMLTDEIARHLSKLTELFNRSI